MSGDLSRDGHRLRDKIAPPEVLITLRSFLLIEPPLTPSGRLSDGSAGDGGLPEADYANPPQGGNGTV
jgi:hypothetical protein